MEDFSTVEGDRLESQGQMDAMEVEHEPPISYIDFFARDNEVNMVQKEVDQSDIGYIDFFAQENHLNDVTDQMVYQPKEQSSISFIDFFARDDQANHVADHVADQRAGQSNLSYDFINIDNQVNAAANLVEESVQNNNYYAAANVGEETVPYNIDYMAEANPLNAASDAVEQSVGDIYYPLENHQLSATANVVEPSVQDIIYYAPENILTLEADVYEQLVPESNYISLAFQLNAAADLYEQSGGNIAPENHLWNIVSYDPENHRLVVEANMVEHSVDDIDYHALENQPGGAANVAQHSVQDVDYIAVANELRAAANVLEQSAGFNSRVMEENGEIGMNDFQDRLVVLLRTVTDQDIGHNDGLSDYDEDAIPEFEQFPDDDPPFEEHPASRAVVRNLVFVIITQESVERDAVACAVCLDEFNVGEMAKKFPCSHYIHQECIFPWLDLQNTCPVCRYELPIDDDSDDERNENETALPE